MLKSFFRRRWAFRVTIAAGAIAGGAMAALIALSFFSSTSPAEANTVAAGTIPQGNTPTAAPSPNPNSPTVSITFHSVSVGGYEITSYNVKRYTGNTSTSAPISGPCSAPSVAHIVTCTDSPGDGTWRYTDVGTYQNWSGQESTKSTLVTVDTTAPSVSVAFPANNGNYNASGWTNGGTAPCGATGTICGQATDAGSGISGASSIAVTITQTSTGKTWNGTSFASGSNTVAATTYNSVSGLWTYTFPNTNFNTNDTYTVSAKATDIAGNTGNSSANSFTYDTVNPSVAVTFPANNGNYDAAGWTGGAPIAGTATDATSGIAGASSIQVTITQSSTGKTWNGSSFATGSNSVSVTTFGSGSWALSFANTNFPADGTYTVSASATDRANNTGGSSTNTFKYDTVTPSVAVTFPVNNGNYNASGWTAGAPIAGTASDATSGIAGASSIQVTITQSSTGKTWNGSSFATGSNTVAASTYDGSSAWTYAFPNSNFPADGTYTVSATVTDRANNTGGSSTNTFKYDTVNPGVTVSFPSNTGNYNAAGWTGGAPVAGTATDASSGIAGASSIVLTITQVSTGKTWNGSSFATGSNTVAASTYDGSSAWTYAFPNSNFPADGTYTVSASATDRANNTGSSSTNTFKYDTVNPGVTVSFPSNTVAYNTAGWAAGAPIAGTATDATSGIAGASSISLTITQSGTGNTWNGSSFASGSNTVSPTSYDGSSGWTYTFPNSNFPADGTYTVSASATDRAGNTGTSATNTFAYDTAAPNTATLTTTGPYNAAGFNALANGIAGTTTDSGTGGHGISAVKVSVQDSGTGKCWNGSNFTTASCPNFISVTAGGTATGANTAGWSYNGLSAGNLANGDTYTVTVQATDATTNGNTSGTLSAGGFDYDVSAPNTATLTTNGAYNTAGWPGAVSGTTTDSGAGGHGISAVNVSIQDSGTGKCWNGSNFTTASCPNFVAVTSGATASGSSNANWTYTLSSAALTNGDTYTVKVQATDATTTGNTSGTLSPGTFDYDTSAPSSATLTTNGAYNTAGWPGAISGTVSDSGTGGHGIGAVNVSIQDSVSGKCWNGTDFVTASCPNYVPVTSGGTATGNNNASWSYTLSSSALTTLHTYTVQVQATDVTTTGNTSGNLSAGTFDFDTTAPSSAALTTSSSYTSGTWPGAIAGTVSDSGTGGHGISAVKVSIQDSVSGKCWNGTNFTTASCPNYVAVTSGGTATGSNNASWSYTLGSAALTAGHTYTVLVKATDATTTGNTSGDLSAGTFFFSTSGITFVGFGTPSTTTGASQALTVQYPGTAVTGDFLLLIMSNSHHEVPSCPTNWTQRENLPTMTGAEASLFICWRFDAGKTTVAITSPGGAANGFSARVAAYRNVNTASPFDVADQTTISSAGATTFNPTGLTTLTANAMAVSVVMQNDATMNSIPALSLTVAQGFNPEFSNGVSSADSDAAALADKSIAPAGSVTFPTWTSTVKPAQSVWIGASMALRPIGAPTITAVSPGGGKATGGDTITVTGTGFTNATTVAFGAAFGTSLSVSSDTSLTVTSPAGTAGTTVDLRVSNPAGTSSVVTADQFTYDTTPTVTNVSPNSGKATGGDTVTITGTGFESTVATTGVKFGGTSATSFTVNSDTQITATTPAGSIGAVDVKVTNTTGTSSVVTADQFTYDTTPTVTLLNANNGSASGTNQITITGTGFLSTVATTGVKFGGTNATAFTVNSDSSITATVPAGSAGTVDVTVTNTTGTSALSSADIYTYNSLPVPTVTNLNPATGPTAGNTSVTISGTNFTATSTVKFGANAAASVTVNGATSITAVSPSGSGAVNVTVTNATGPSTSTATFTYNNGPTFIGAGTPQTTTGTTQALTVPYPAGTTTGDFLLLVMTNGHHETSTCPTSPVWTQSGATALQMGGGDDEASITICYRFDAGETGSVGITSPGGAANGFTARILAFRNVNATNPFDTSNVNTVTGTLNQGTFNPTGLTTATANAMVVSFVAQAEDSTTIPTLSFTGGTAQGFTVQYSSGVSSMQSFAGAMANKTVASAGAVTFPTWATTTTSAKSVWVGISVALRSA